MEESTLFYLMVAGAAVSGVGFSTALENFCDGEIAGTVYIAVGVIGILMALPIWMGRKDMLRDLFLYWLTYIAGFMLIVMACMWVVHARYDNPAWGVSLIALAVLTAILYYSGKASGLFGRVGKLGQ